MKKLVLLIIANIIYINTYSQCECTDCPLFVPSLTTQSSTLNISGSTNPTLGVGGQSLCKVCIDFNTDAIDELDLILIAPNGSMVTLISHTGGSVNSNLEFTICFLACSDFAMPDAGHADVFDSSESWGSNSAFIGSYYPNIGCLEDLTGTVNGSWTLQIQDFVGLDDSTINDWYLVFGDDSGLDCANASDCGIVCDADAGVLTILNNPTCPADIITFSSSLYNSTSAFEEYLLIVDDAGIIVGFIQGDSYNYSYDYCGTFTVYSYNLEIGGGSTIPSIGNNIIDYDCNTNCCDLIEETITFEDNLPPFFTSVPEHPNFPGGGPFVPINCIDDLNPLNSAMYDDNCIDPGSATGIEIDNTTACNGGTIVRRWEISDSCSLLPSVEEQIIIIEPKPLATYINPPADITVACGDVPSSAINLDYSNGLINSCASDGTASPVLAENYDACGGTATFTWSTLDECNRIVAYVQSITVNEAAQPQFVNPPIDITVDCNNIPATAADIEITNGLSGACEISDFVSPILTNNYNGCSGEVIVEWNYTDICNRNFVEQQIITIAEAPLASFVNPPTTITTTCGDFGSISSFLDYSNNSSGDCDISGSVEGILLGNFDGCGGNVSYLWEFTDACGRMISHTQDIIVTPASDPTFVITPVDITLDCGETTYLPPPLAYTNNESNPCLINGFVNATTISTGNQIMVDWTLVLPCSIDFLTATQIVTLVVQPEIFLTPQEIHICQGGSYDLQNVEVIDINNTGGFVSYHSATPPDVSNELTSSTVSPLTNTVYYVMVSTDEGCFDFQPFTVIIDTPDNIATDGIGVVCDDNTIYNLFDFLSSVNNLNGTWLDLDNSTIVFSDPSMVSFNGILPGEYSLGYTALSTTSCPTDTAYAIIDVVETVEILVTDVMCSPDMNSYSVSFTVTISSNITVNLGMLSGLGSGNYIIENIPIANSLTIMATDHVTACSAEVSVSPPDCSCPTIDPPVNLGDEVVCIEGLPIELAVSVGMDQSASWYLLAVEGIALATEILTYMPDETLPGIYTYYVETIDLINIGCVSTIRTPILLTILNSPLVSDTTIVVCQDYQTSTTSFILSDANMLIASNPSYSIMYYATEEDAFDNQNILDDSYVNTDGINKIVYARIEDSFGCLAFAQLQLEVLLPPEATLFIMDETCFEDSNGTVAIIPISAYLQFTNVDNGTYDDILFYENLNVGSHTISLQDSFQCINEILFEIEQGIELSISEFNISCDDNETNSIFEDDTLTITLNIISTSNDPNFELLFDGLSFGEYPFGESIELIFPADSITHVFTFVDVSNGCTITYETNVFSPCSSPCDSLPNSTIHIDPNSVLNCFVQSVEVSSSLEPNVMYNWYVQGQSVSTTTISIDEASEVILIAIDTMTGCTSSDTINILDLEAYPFVDVQVQDTLTCLNDEVLIDGSTSQSGPNLIYNWTSEGQHLPMMTSESIIPVDIGGWYYLEVIDTIIGCSNIDSVFVTELTNYPQITLEKSFTSECGVDSIPIFAGIISAETYNTLWSTLDGIITTDPSSDMITGLGSGTYLVSVTNQESGCSIADSIVVITYPTPILTSILIEDESCFEESNGTILFDPLDLGNLPFQYVINGELFSSDEIIDLSPGQYNIVGIDANGCEIDRILNINEATDWEVTLPIKFTFVANEDNKLIATVNIDSSFIQSIEWSPSTSLSCDDCLSPTLFENGESNYSIEVIDINGCLSSATIAIVYDINTDIDLPNTFSPNGDGNNDYFVITIPPALVLDNLTMQVFDRWGERIYSNDNLNNAAESEFWDGKFKGIDVQLGVYVFMIEAKVKESSDVISLIGDVTILR